MVNHSMNKGEWAELYCLFKTISDARLVLSCHDLSTSGEYLDVVGGLIHRDSNQGSMEYTIEGERIVFQNEHQNLAISKNDFLHVSQLIQEVLFEKHTKTFSLPHVQQFMQMLGTRKLKSHSFEKSDAHFAIPSDFHPNHELLGFSIKSFVANNPTLVNASGATNFIFQVDDNTNYTVDYSQLKAKKLIKRLHDDNAHLHFISAESDVYTKNLMRIDTVLPNILAEALKIYYASTLRYLHDIVEILAVQNPLKFDDVSLYEYKIKEFLFNSCVAVFPDKVWNGERSVDGGCIIVTHSGDLRTFYIVRSHYLSEFKHYLYHKSYFDTASTTRHKFGKIYRDEVSNQRRVKLNLQVRVAS